MRTAIKSDNKVVVGNLPTRYVPNDIVSSILSKLPAKSVLRFMSVSRSWKCMIKSPDFVSAHHHHHQITYKNKECCSLIYMSDDRYVNQQVCIFVHAQQTNDLVFPLSSGVYSVIGVCEGLICLKKTPLIYIWNPVSKKLKTVQPIAKSKPYLHEMSDIIYGFGFSRRSNDYRVVKIFIHVRIITEVDVYSLATNSWTRVELPEKPVVLWISSVSGVSSKGSIYWLAGSYYEEPTVILRFDVEEEIFEMVALPPLQKVVRMPELTVVNGFLVLFEVRRRDVHVWAYILNKGMWSTKSVVLPKEEKENKYTRMTNKGGQIILERKHDHRLFAYDSYYDGDNLSFKFRDLKMHQTRSGNFHLIPVLDSLLWLDQHNNE